MKHVLLTWGLGWPRVNYLKCKKPLSLGFTTVFISTTHNTHNNIIILSIDCYCTLIVSPKICMINVMQVFYRAVTGLYFWWALHFVSCKTCFSVSTAFCHSQGKTAALLSGARLYSLTACRTKPTFFFSYSSTCQLCYSFWIFWFLICNVDSTIIVQCSVFIFQYFTYSLVAQQWTSMYMYCI